jgi:hypothetical protein
MDVTGAIQRSIEQSTRAANAMEEFAKSAERGSKAAAQSVVLVGQQMRAYLSVRIDGGIYQDRALNLRFDVRPMLINTGLCRGQARQNNNVVVKPKDTMNQEFEVISHTSAPFTVPDPEKTVRILADTKRMSALAYILIDYNHYRIRNIFDGQTLIIENCLGWTEAGKTIPAGTPIQVLPCSLIGVNPLS